MVIYVLDPFNCIIFKNSFYGIRIKKGKIIIAGMGSEGRGGASIKLINTKNLKYASYRRV